MRWANVLAATLLLLALPWLADQAERVAAPRRVALTRWLLACQDGGGGLRNHPDAADITPYFANLAGLALLETQPGPARVKAYLNWYLARLNERDRYGLTGTVYDQQPARTGPPGYDSADAYAATFLSLARAYVERTGDWAWARAQAGRLDAVGRLLFSLQDPDGLVRTGGPSSHRFLMDNAEDYRGLEDWAWLLHGMGRVNEAAGVRLKARLLAVAVGDVLWDPVSASYRWASPPWPPPPSETAGHLPDWSRWYPDTVAQVFPSLYGLPEPPGRAALAYSRLAAAFPGWTEGRTGDRFPWLTLGLAAWKQGDRHAVRELLDHARKAYPAGSGWSQPGWQSHEAAAELRLRLLLESPAWGVAWRLLNGSY